MSLNNTCTARLNPQMGLKHKINPTKNKPHSGNSLAKIKRTALHKKGAIQSQISGAPYKEINIAFLRCFISNYCYRWTQLYNTNFCVINKTHATNKRPDVAKMSTARTLLRVKRALLLFYLYLTAWLYNTIRLQWKVNIILLLITCHFFSSGND